MPQEVPRIDIPLHTVMELIPRADGTMAETRFYVNVDKALLQERARQKAEAAAAAAGRWVGGRAGEGTGLHSEAGGQGAGQGGCLGPGRVWEWKSMRPCSHVQGQPCIVVTFEQRHACVPAGCWLGGAMGVRLVVGASHAAFHAACCASQPAERRCARPAQNPHRRPPPRPRAGTSPPGAAAPLMPSKPVGIMRRSVSLKDLQQEDLVKEDEVQPIQRGLKVVVGSP